MLGLQLQSPVSGSFWTGTEVGLCLLALPLTAVQTPPQNCPSAFYWIKGTFLEDGLLHKGDKPCCWEGFWKCLHWEGQGWHPAPEAVL